MAKARPKKDEPQQSHPETSTNRNLCYVVASLLPHLGAVNAGPLASAALLVDVDANSPYPLSPDHRKEWDEAAIELDAFTRQLLIDVVTGKGVNLSPDTIRVRSRVEVFVTLVELYS